LKNFTDRMEKLNENKSKKAKVWSRFW
jgi:hypothetical protein